MTPRVDADMPDAMRRRSTILTVTTAIALLLAVVAAGAGSGPVLGKGKRRKAKAATLQLPPIAYSPMPSASAAPSVSVSASASATVAAPPPTTAHLTIGKGSKVLVFGDSMVDAGFAQRLQKLVEARGGSLVHDSWVSSTTTSWSKGARLDNLLALHKPDVVIVALGANEVFLPSPEVIAPRVRTIVQKLTPRTCLWVSPPLWKGETGIVGVERLNSTPCGFFDSGTVTVERAKDGIHPTPRGGSDWADAVFLAVAAEG